MRLKTVEHFEDSCLKTLSSRLRVKFSKRFNLRVEAKRNRCTHTVPLFHQFGEKALRNFMPEYLVSKIKYSVNSLGATDKD
jgi:hypothetical protein